MKKSVLTSLLTLFSFVGGLAVSSSSQSQKAQDKLSNEATTEAVSTPTPCPASNEFPNLLDDKYITPFNGERIDLDYETGVMSGEVPWAVDSAKVTPLKDGDLLINVGDTLYRMDRQRQIRWSYHTAQILFDYAYVDATNLIYGTAGDNFMFILDATTGKAELTDGRNGSAAYGVAQKYGDDMCLVTDNFVMYREKFRDNPDPMKDGLTCWRGTKILWQLDFPPDAELVVNGTTILAVTKTRKGIFVNEIIPPQN